jgi:prepilin-type N-terminal cleavage/methylation domain-containing protein
VIMVKGRVSRVEGQKHALALRTRSIARPSTLDSRPFRGFTLIELLVVMFIITILASLILGVAALAAQTARENNSRHTVERLHTLLTEFYGTFKTRRINLRQDDPITGTKGIETQIKAAFSNDGPKVGQAKAEARLYALRELMLMEVPDRWSDVALAQVTNVNNVGDPLYLDAPAIQYAATKTLHRTDLANVYLRRYQALWGRTNSITGLQNTAADIKANQSAECLYMVITLACGEGEARAQFGEHSIGDTDGDGAPEFLDGWGHPISFLRWAPGFESQIELSSNDLDATPTVAEVNTKIAKDHDPFDVFRVDAKAYRLVPLIYSGGRDESTGIYDAPDFATWQPVKNFRISNSTSPPYLGPQLTPYQTASDGAGHNAYLGTSMHLVDSNVDETSTDNVHNHVLGQR